MAEEAADALGAGAVETLRRQAVEAEADLVARSTPGFRAFAGLLASHGPG